MNQPASEKISAIIYQISRLKAPEALRHLAAEFPGKVTFSTSFSMEDQVIADMILTNRLPISIFTLDTGRLFPETYSVWTATLEKYGAPIQAFYPDAEELEAFVQKKGPNSFYQSVENRKQCCHIRKVEPLKRALKDQQIWITGLRSEHSPDRKQLPPVEWDESNRILKFHPLLSWSTGEVRKYIDAHEVPYNILHDRGFVSIGCAPCTRAIQPGEDFRAGRWWWEDASKKECGLHTHAGSTENLATQSVHTAD